MNLNEELSNLIKLAIDGAKNQGVSLNQKIMAEHLDIGATYLSRLKSGQEPVTNKFLVFFKDKFKDYLPSKREITEGDIAVLQSHIDVIEREIAKLKKEVFKNVSNKDVKEYLQELLDEVSLSEVGKQVQNDG